MSDENKALNKRDTKRLAEKRGTGFGKDYVPFIKVGEFSSSGESIRVKSCRKKGSSLPFRYRVFSFYYL